MRHQHLQRIEHMPVAQVPAGRRAPVHRPVISFRGANDARVLLGVEIGIAVLGDQSHPMRE